MVFNAEYYPERIHSVVNINILRTSEEVSCLITELVDSLECMFGHIGVREDSTVPGDMLIKYMGLLADSSYNVRMAFR